jgi:hypothetical protein
VIIDSHAHFVPPSLLAEVKAQRRLFPSLATKEEQGQLCFAFAGAEIARSANVVRRDGIVVGTIAMPNSPRSSCSKRECSLVRGAVKALSDPGRQAEARILLRERFGTAKPIGLRALLAAAPLESIDLSRNTGWEIAW